MIYILIIQNGNVVVGSLIFPDLIQGLVLRASPCSFDWICHARRSFRSHLLTSTLSGYEWPKLFTLARFGIRMAADKTKD